MSAGRFASFLAVVLSSWASMHLYVFWPVLAKVTRAFLPAASHAPGHVADPTFGAVRVTTCGQFTESHHVLVHALSERRTSSFEVRSTLGVRGSFGPWRAH